jgi:hypothetical protein
MGNQKGHGKEWDNYYISGNNYNNLKSWDNFWGNQQEYMRYL